MSKSVGINQYGSRSQFAWPTVLDAPLGVATTSACVKLTGVAGLSNIQPHNVTLGSISINGGAFLTTAQSVKEGDEVRVRVNASNTPDGLAYLATQFDGGEYLGNIEVRSQNADRAAQTFQVGPSRAYKQLSAVTSMLRAGDVVEVDPGIYSPVEFTRAGSASAPITIRGIGSSRPVISGGDYTVRFTTAHNVVFENFEVTGGTQICLRTQAHNVVVRNVFIHDCLRHGVLGADLGNGNNTFDRIEVTRSGGTYAGENLKHTIYVATDRDAFPGGTLRVQHSYLHDSNGEMIKSRSARAEIYYNWIDAQISSSAYYSVSLYGFEEYETDAPLNGDVVGNVLIHRSTYGMRLGGDGTGTSKGHVRLANNTFILGTAFGTSPVIRLYQSLDSLYLVNNAFVRNGSAATALRLFQDDIAAADWVGGRVKIAGRSNFMPAGTPLETANPAEWSGSVYGAGGILNSLVGSVDTGLPPGSPLLSSGGSLASVPVGYEVTRELTTLSFSAPSTAPVSGEVITPKTRTAGTLNIGAQ